MEDASIDLRDHRGRLVRLAVSVLIGVLVTIGILRQIQSVAETPNPDPIAGSSVGLLAIGLFVASTAFTLTLISALTRRWRGVRE